MELVVLVSNVPTMKKTHDDKPELIVLVLESRKKRTYLQSSTPLDVLQAPTIGVAPSLCPKLHKLQAPQVPPFELWRHKP